MMNERPADGGSYGGGLGGGNDDWPKASIGNYKGVMLCNRPNEIAGPRKADRTGPNVPFNSRVFPEEPIGWNPTKKLAPRDIKRRKNVDPNNALLKHKRFLKTLEDQRFKEKENKEREYVEKEERVTKLKDQAEKQRKKIAELKRPGGGSPGAADDEGSSPDRAVAEEAIEVDVPSVGKLTEENLRKSEIAQQEIQKKQPSKPSSQKQKNKPAWALTEKDVEEQKEKEIDELLEFAYELDYEKYMDDFEVR